MNYQSLYNELTNDPQSMGYAGKSDMEASILLLGKHGDPILSSVMLTGRTLLDVLSPARGEVVLQGLDAIGQSTSPMAPVVARAALWMMPSEQGIDIGLPAVRGMLDTLAQIVLDPVNKPDDKFLTTEEVVAIKALAESDNSRAITIGCPSLTWYDVHLARKRSA